MDKINLIFLCFLFLPFIAVKVNSTHGDNIKKLCACVKTRVHNKSLDKGSKGSSSNKLLEECNSDCSGQKADNNENKKSKRLKIGRSKSEKDAIEMNKREIENLKKELLNLKSKMAEINENNEENVLKEKSRVKSEIVEINEKKDKNVIGENRRAKSFDYYPSQPDRNISLPEGNEIDLVKHDHELAGNYYGFDPSQRFKLFQIEAAERRRKKIASRTNSANSSNSNTKPSTSANTESDKAINSKSNEIENVDEIVEISPRNYDKPLSNLSKLSLEIEEISEEIPEDAEALKNKKEIKEGKKMRALSDSEIDKPSCIQKQKISSKSARHFNKINASWKEKLIKMKRFSSLKSFSSKEIKLGGHKNEKEINEQRSFSETNFKYSEGSENKLESLKMSPLPESTNLLPKRLNQSPGKYSPRQKMKSLWQNAVEAGRKTLAKQKSRESQSSIGTINSNNLETLDTESLYFTPVAIFVDENDDDSQKEEKEKSPKKFKRKEQI